MDAQRLDPGVAFPSRHSEDHRAVFDASIDVRFVRFGIRRPAFGLRSQQH
jgi:hypothetical protein